MTVRAQRPEVGTVAYQHWKTASAECRSSFTRYYGCCKVNLRRAQATADGHSRNSSRRLKLAGPCLMAIGSTHLI
jgi:hypothetical protein